MRQYATNRKVAGSVPNVIEFFSFPNPSSRTMALGSTHPLTEMFKGIKGVRRVMLTTLPLTVS
jgi:hypothetical protein